MTTLKGKTLFITGASRGIGLAIALRAAKDGANIAIAAKSAEPHKHLPGTIYTAAEEIEALEKQHEENPSARAVSKFGGVDICVNNASAISLAGTEATDMKRWDLMHSINARGTFLTSKTCIPHLKKSSNPHVLMLSPPLDMSPKWFGGHTAYTMAKYGMSMCVLGMAAEFKQDGIAFNALWPRTAIATAAVKFALGGDAMMQASRSVDILSDCAHLIFTKPAKDFTGNFIIDDNFLYENGVTDLEKYRVDPSKKLAPDFFVPDSATPPPGVAETLMSGMLGG